MAENFTRAMVVAPQPEATECGIEVLRAGGNAVDAAIAAAFVQGVVDPLMCGIAGFGSMAVWRATDGAHEYVDFHAPAPAASTPDMWEDLIEGEARDGFGFTLNLPMMPRSGDDFYRRAMEESVLPALEKHDPDALLVSAGFDAAAPDPLAHIELTPSCFGWMARQLGEAAGRCCDGRLIALLEGGYDLESLADCVEAHVRGLLAAG